MNHCQATGQDQCGKLKLHLEAAGYSVWLDMSADDLTASGMEEAVSQSRNVIIFLSDGIMSRPFCQAEQRWALHYGCNLIGLMEMDGRHNPAVIAKENESAPADLKRLFTQVDFNVYQRKGYLEKAMIEEVIKQRCHTVIKDGYLEKKGGEIEIHQDAGKFTVVKKRNILKGGSRAWLKRWFVLYDDGILQWYENGPTDQLDRNSVSRRSLSREFAAASIEMSGEVDLCVAGLPCRWFPGGLLGLSSDRIVLEVPESVTGTKQSRGGIELRAVDKSERLTADPSGGWVAATAEFGATVESLDLGGDDSGMDGVTGMLMQAVAGAAEETVAAVLKTWEVEAVAKWLEETLAIPHVAENVRTKAVDGKTAAAMDKADWRELEATGVESAKIWSSLKAM